MVGEVADEVGEEEVGVVVVEEVGVVVETADEVGEEEVSVVEVEVEEGEVQVEEEDEVEDGALAVEVGGDSRIILICKKWSNTYRKWLEECGWVW